MTYIEKMQILGIGTFILCLVGLYNGYPLVYSDTGTYLYSGFDLFIPVDRPITYGLFLRVISFKFSAWFIIIAQNFLTAFVIYEFLKIFLFKKEYFARLYYSILFFLVIFTGIGWYSNQLMPDFLTPLVIVIIFTLLLSKDLSIFSQIFLIVILLFGLGSHFSHLLIASILIVAIIVLRKIFKDTLNEISFRRIIVVASFIFAGWFVLPIINYLTEKQFILSKGSHVFIMGHLNDTGILKKFLKENCESPDFKDCQLCQYKDSLPVDLDGFLWSGKILPNTGGWLGSKEEYNKIIAATLKKPKFLFLNIYKSLTYGLVQLTKNEIGQGLDAYNEGSPPYGQIHWRFNDELNNYLNSRQNKRDGAELNLDILNTFHSILILVSLLICILLFSSSIFKSIELNGKLFLIFAILAILINSLSNGGLNYHCERFQARVVWLLPLSIIIILIKNYALIIQTIFSKRHD